MSNEKLPKSQDEQTAQVPKIISVKMHSPPSTPWTNAAFNSGLSEAFAKLVTSGKITPDYSPYANLGFEALIEPQEKRADYDALKTKVEETVQQLTHEKLEGVKAKEELAHLKKLLIEIDQGRKAEEVRQKRVIEDLERRRELNYILSRVTPPAQEKIIADEVFRDQFMSTDPCPTYVISIDLRRSTELMLKARTPELFADFMTGLCLDLEEVIKANFGVVDKFTGDGMLAFFPDFFSGPDAGYYAIATAEAAHKAFRTRYREHRKSFTTVLNDVGMGIGLDYGDVRIVRVAGGLTVVGPAVVYACRMGNAPAGKTYLNQPAYEQISDAGGYSCFITETELEIKHEGGTLAYDLRLTNDKPFTPRTPLWLES